MGAAGRSAACGASCAAVNVLGFIMAPACCTSGNKCGVDLSALGSSGCAEQNAAGTIDARCPNGSLAGLITLQGCCRSDGTCGVMDTFVGLGCTDNPSGQRSACAPR
jgi:hypothetical protein